MTLVSAATAFCQTSEEVYVGGRVEVVGVKLQGNEYFPSRFVPFLCLAWYEVAVARSYEERKRNR